MRDSNFCVSRFKCNQTAFDVLILTILLGITHNQIGCVISMHNMDYGLAQFLRDLVLCDIPSRHGCTFFCRPAMKLTIL